MSMLMRLPLQCEAYYFRDFIELELAQSITEYLCQSFNFEDFEIIEIPERGAIPIIPWKMNFLSPRLAKLNMFSSHHGRSCEAFPDMLTLMEKVNAKLNTQFDVCVCLYYPDGHEYLDFHTDYSAFGPVNKIASLSIGAERQFMIRERGNRERISLELQLEDRSLLVMGDNFQNLYEHALVKQPHIKLPRFNFTFRQFDKLD